MLKNDLQENHLLPSFSFFVRRSFYLHLAILIFAISGGKVILEQKKLLRDKNIELIEASVKVDMVAMPKYTLNELQNISSGVDEVKPTEVKKVEEPKVEPKVEKKIEEIKPLDEAKNNELALLEEKKASEKKHSSFLNKLKEISNQKIKSKGNQKAEKGLGGEKNTAFKELILAGNKLSNGTAITGSGKTADMTAFQIYVSKLPDRVRPHWKLPTFLLTKKELKCRIRIWLNLSGELKAAEVYQTSGVAEFDQRAIEAVRSASPFPKLQEDFGKRAQNGDIVLGFPL
jgi:TonB family protein